jgi:hypothetical protein
LTPTQRTAPTGQLADDDYRRAWQLDTKITGYAAPFDR